MIAELLRGACKNDAGLIGQERRKRIFALPRRLERITGTGFTPLQIAGLAGDAEFVFGAIVERLEIGVSQGPVGER